MGTAAVKLSLKKEEEQTGNINGHYITFQIRNEVLQSVRTAAVKQPLKKKSNQATSTKLQYSTKSPNSEAIRRGERHSEEKHTHTQKKSLHFYTDHTD